MLKGLILIGGKSSRMGEPKHLLKRGGLPQYQFIYDLLLSLGIQSYISCNREQVKTFKDEHSVVVDSFDSIGPIGGVASAFEKEPETSWLVVACDLLSLSKEAIVDLVSANVLENDVVTYQKKGSPFLETTITIYNPTAAPFVSESVKSKEYSLQKLLKKCSVKTLEVGSSDFLKNVNTKSDYLNS